MHINDITETFVKLGENNVLKCEKNTRSKMPLFKSEERVAYFISRRQYCPFPFLEVEGKAAERRARISNALLALGVCAC